MNDKPPTKETYGSRYNGFDLDTLNSLHSPLFGYIRQGNWEAALTVLELMKNEVERSIELCKQKRSAITSALHVTNLVSTL